MTRLLSILSLALVLSACGSSPESLRYRENPGASPKISINTCQGNQLSVRLLSVSGTDFRQALGGLVSATMDPNTLGDVSGAATGTTGVEMQMTLTMSETKEIVESTSQFRLIIKDSWVGQKGTDGRPIDPIMMVHNAQSHLIGNWDAQKKVLTVKFSDPFGEINIQGAVQNNLLIGQVTYKNTTSWDGSSPRQGTLGQFQSQAGTCGF